MGNVIFKILFVLIALSGLGFLIFVHELGHFIVAKLSKVKVKEAAIGFGPKIVKKQWGETLYGVGILPLGGYVKLAGMEPEESIEPGEEDRAFDNQPIFKKIAIIAAGPVMNILIAIPLFALVLQINGIDIATTVISKVLPGSAAQKAQMKPGDKIIRIDNKLINKWEDVSRYVGPRPGKEVTILVKRDGENVRLRTVVGEREVDDFVDGKVKKVKRGFLGIESKTIHKNASFLASIKKGVVLTFAFTTMIIKILGSLVTGGIPASTIAEGSAGPVGVVFLSSEMLKKSALDFLWFLAIISPNLAVVNLIPFPPLDGSRVAFIIFEKLRGKPISKERFMQMQAFGTVLLITLIMILTVTDISRIINNSFIKDF